MSVFSNEKNIIYKNFLKGRKKLKTLLRYSELLKNKIKLFLRPDMTLF